VDIATRWPNGMVGWSRFSEHPNRPECVDAYEAAVLSDPLAVFRMVEVREFLPDVLETDAADKGLIR
jgi:hypothetical protein